MERQNRKRKLISLFTAAIMIVATLISSIGVFAAEEENVTEITQVEIIKMPDKLEYMSGELVDLSGATIELTFSDGKTEEIDITKKSNLFMQVMEAADTILMINTLYPVNGKMA